MNIKPTDLINGVAAYKNQSAQAKKVESQAKRGMKPDEFIISSHSAELQNIDRQAREVSEVRPELVAELRGRVQSGDYRVDSYELAARIIETHKGLL